MNAQPPPSPTAPDFVVKILVQTRGWAVFSAFGLLFSGIIAVFRVRQQWRESLSAGEPALEDASALEKGLSYLDAGFTAVFGAACFYVGFRLFRYAAAISRLRTFRGMRQLESALRHQRAVWIVFGTLAAFWLLLFAWQLWEFLATLWEAGVTGVDPLEE